MPTLDNTKLTELQFATTYAAQAGKSAVEVAPADLLELVDVYELLKGQSAFAAFKEQLERARRAEAELAELRMAHAARHLLKVVENGTVTL